jgi:hypothetical protein
MIQHEKSALLAIHKISFYYQSNTLSWSPLSYNSQCPSSIALLPATPLLTLQRLDHFGRASHCH